MKDQFHANSTHLVMISIAYENELRMHINILGAPTVTTPDIRLLIRTAVQLLSGTLGESVNNSPNGSGE